MLTTATSFVAKQGITSQLLKTSSIKSIQRTLSAASATNAERIKYFKIYRWDPEQRQKPYVATYPVI